MFPIIPPEQTLGRSGESLDLIPVVNKGFAESDPHEEKAPSRVIILKQRFPHFIRKTIVRSTVKCTILTIVDSDDEKREAHNHNKLVVSFPHWWSRRESNPGLALPSPKVNHRLHGSERSHAIKQPR